MESDRAFAEILNNSLDAIEAGEASIEDCLARYPQHADRLEGLLRLSDEARMVPLPTPTPEMLTAGERQLVQAIRSRAAEGRSEPRHEGLLGMLSKQLIEPAKVGIGSLPKWFPPVAALSGSVAVLFICVILAVVGRHLAWRGLRSAGATPGSPPAALSEEGGSASPLPGPTGASALFLPFAVSPLPPDLAMLEEVRGVVEVQADDGTWSVASTRQTVEAGGRVRTGALSGVDISFYDGSTAYLGPNTEVSIDALGQDPEDQSRLVELTQWVGETDHDVAPSYGNARYEVHTPSGTGEAKGTLFHVSVTPALVVHFRVDEGAVAVTHLDVTVVVVAGQLTTIDVGKPPAKPVFRVSGEGEVEETGTTWRIAGQSFQTHDATEVIGNPQVGDWVHVDGHLLPDGTRVADRIVLLRRSPANRFTITGEVEARGVVTWTVAGQEIAVSDETEIDDGIQVGDRVRVEGVIKGQDGGTLVAESIHLIEAEGLPFSFVGVVEDISDAYWTISGISVTVGADTVLGDGLAVGDAVQVRGVIEADGTWLARSIRRLVPEKHRFEFVGIVESIDPWVVSGIALETRMWTEIKDGIEVGDRVEVEGLILPDGTWLADEIELADEDEDEDDDLSFEFVGRVESIEPWVVSGISLTVNHRTEIKDGIEVGDKVKVEGRILTGGAWLATEIKLVDAGPGHGCIQFASVVVRVGTGEVVLQNGATIPVDGSVQITGDIQVDSVILFYLCVDNEGEMTVVSIVVVYQMEPEFTVHPTPRSRDDDGDCGDDHDDDDCHDDDHDDDDCDDDHDDDDCDDDHHDDDHHDDDHHDDDD